MPALEGTFDAISGIAQSKNGDLYVVANMNHVLLKLSGFNKAEGTWSNVTIIAGTGSQGKGDDDIVGTQSALSYPIGLSLIDDDSTGEVTALLIADRGNHRIRQLDMSTQIITTIAGTGTSGFSGDDLPATAAKLSNPRHVYYDKSTGDIYIVDTNNFRIRRVRNDIITTVAGKTCSVGDGLGDGGQAVDACLSGPFQFTMNNAGEWFIVDYGNLRIRKVYLNGTITTVVGGGTETGDAPATSVKLSNPISIAFMSSGELLVAGIDGDAIRKMDHSGYLKVIAGGGSKAPSPDNPIPAKTANIAPLVIAYARDGSDDIFIGDFSGIIFKLSTLTKCYGVWSDDSAVCFGHGSCIGTDQCLCNSGWMQVDCSITHCFGFSSNLPDKVCSGRGKCVRPNKCHCNDGHRGHKCHKLPKK